MMSGLARDLSPPASKEDRMCDLPASSERRQEVSVKGGRKGGGLEQCALDSPPTRLPLSSKGDKEDKKALKPPPAKGTQSQGIHLALLSVEPLMRRRTYADATCGHSGRGIVIRASELGEVRL